MLVHVQRRSHRQQSHEHAPLNGCKDDPPQDQNRAHAAEQNGNGDVRSLRTDHLRLREAQDQAAEDGEEVEEVFGKAYFIGMLCVSVSWVG